MKGFPNTSLPCCFTRRLHQYATSVYESYIRGGTSPHALSCFALQYPTCCVPAAHNRTKRPQATTPLDLLARQKGHRESGTSRDPDSLSKTWDTAQIAHTSSSSSTYLAPREGRYHPRRRPTDQAHPSPPWAWETRQPAQQRLLHSRGAFRATSELVPPVALLAASLPRLTAA